MYMYYVLQTSIQYLSTRLIIYNTKAPLSAHPETAPKANRLSEVRICSNERRLDDKNIYIYRHSISGSEPTSTKRHTQSNILNISVSTMNAVSSSAEAGLIIWLFLSVLFPVGCSLAFQSTSKPKIENFEN